MNHKDSSPCSGSPRSHKLLEAEQKNRSVLALALKLPQAPATAGGWVLQGVQLSYPK